MTLRHSPRFDAPTGIASGRPVFNWRFLVGVALLWFSLASLVHVATAESSPFTPWLSAGAFLVFASGIGLLLEALRRAIVQDLRT